MATRRKAIVTPQWKPSDLRERLTVWMAEKGWTPLPHQQEMWDAIANGESGILEMPTGAGKTYAAFFGFLPLLGDERPGLRLLYITPLRALTRDLEKALLLPRDELNLPLLIESRTGDTKSSQRARQRKALPHVLITTPESLALLLSYPEAPQMFSSLRGIVIDEWHELMGSKRGSLLELNLARLRTLSSGLQTWALSATIKNAREAAKSACGLTSSVRVLSGPFTRPLDIQTLLPAAEDRMPWAGHIGLKMLPQVLVELDNEETSLIFTNTRSQAERWFEALQMSRPDWADRMALHHGSLELKQREAVEQGVKEGRLRIVVCTASLDLGVDFPAVDRVFQIGSPKQIARLIQRAGRSAHSPGKTSQLVFVPTHALEILEIHACREAITARDIEARKALHKPLDVLAQHMVSSALAGGFREEELLAEVRTSLAFHDLSEDEFNWVLVFVRDGGGTLKAYPQYCKIVYEDGRYIVPDRTIAARHRQNVGTIISDASVLVKLGKGKRLGTIEESFLARLKKGDSFLFAGRWLELITIQELTAYVRLAHKGSGHIPVWSGGTLPWSPILSEHLRELCHAIGQGDVEGPEIASLQAILEAQDRLSAWPLHDELLIEIAKSREGTHIFIYPFEGRQIHEGIAFLVSSRLNRLRPMSCSIAVNDYGMEILCSVEIKKEELHWPELFSLRDWQADVEEALNTKELERRQFRGIARVAGLVLQNVPGTAKSTRQIQTSSGLLFDVFQRFEPGNLLLHQAHREVMELHFNRERLVASLERMMESIPLVKELEFFSPLGFPLFIERTSARLSSESAMDRIERMRAEWQKKYQQKSGARRSSSSRKKQPSGNEERL